MTWPTTDVVTTAMDAGTDTPPRAEILSWAQKFNQMRAHVSPYIQGLLDDADASAARATLGLSDVVTLTGNQTVAGIKTFSSTPVVPDGSFTYAKIQNVTAAKVLGRNTSGSGVVQELPIAVDASGNVGLNTSSPSRLLDVNGVGVSVGTKTALSAAGGNISYRNDTGTNQWVSGILGTAAETAFSLFNASSSTTISSVATNGQHSSVIPGGSTLYPEYKCRAWVNFNGTGTVAIRASGNVSSITDNGTGDYTVNLSNLMPDVNYAALATCGNQAALSRPRVFITTAILGSGSIRFEVTAEGGASADRDNVNVAIFR